MPEVPATQATPEQMVAYQRIADGCLLQPTAAFNRRMAELLRDATADQPGFFSTPIPPTPVTL